MGRSEARLQFSIWRGLDGASPHARLVYAVLLTEQTVNQAGVGAIRDAKWAADSGLSEEELAKALDELEDGRWAYLDRSTHEVLIRSFVRNDRVWRQPNVLRAACAQARLVASPKLRKVLAVELRKLPPKPSDSVTKDKRKFVHPDPHACADELDPPVDNPPPEPFPNPSGRVREPSESEPFSNPSRTPWGGGGGGGSSSCPVDGDLGGRARAREEPPRRPRCEQHADLPADDPGPNCVRCRDARVAVEAASVAAAQADRDRRAAERAAMRACPDCDDEGWRLGADGTPVEPAERCRSEHHTLRAVS